MQTQPATQQKGSRVKLWTAPFLKIMSINSCITLCNSMMTQSLPLFVMFLGSSEAVAGTLTGIYTISSLFCRPFFGNMVDTKGRKTVLLIGISIFVVTCFSYSLTSAVIIILVIRSLQGMGNSAFSTTAGTVAADVLPPTRLNEGIGYYGVSFNVATAFGPALMLFLRDGFGYTSVFFASCAMSILAFALGMTMNYEKKLKAEAAARNEPIVVPERKKLSLNTALEKTAIPGALVMILIMCPQGLIQTFLVKYSETLGVSGISLYFTFSAVAMMLSRLFVGRVCDRVGPQKVLPPGLGLIFCGLLTIAFSRSLVPFLLAGMMNGFGFGIVNPTIQAFVLRSAPYSRRGAASGTYYSANDLGNGIGSILGGVLAQTIGFTLTFGLYAIFVVGAFAVFFFILRKKITPADCG